MSHQSTHSMLNSTPQAHQQQHPQQPNHTDPIKLANDRDNDVVFFGSVPKVVHTPQDYPECKCSTCRLVRRLMAECTSAKCRPGQPETSQTVNQTVGQVLSHVQPPSSESIISQNNDDSSTREQHINENDNKDDDDRSKSSTPDYLPRFFDEDDHNDSRHDKESEHSKDESADSTLHVKCPKCTMAYTLKSKLLHHYRKNHQQWKPYYCRWPMCEFTSAVDGLVSKHVEKKHLHKSSNRQAAKKYVGKRTETGPKDVELEQIVGMKFGRKKDSNCPECGRNLLSGHIKRHIRTHAKPGYRCAWLKCGFFYPFRQTIRKHILREHFKGKLVNSTQIDQYLIEEGPDLSNSNGLSFQHKMLHNLQMN